jgi:hypothetical protein
LDPQAAITPIPIESVDKDTGNTIKNLAIKSNPKQKRYVIITKCLCDPCPIFYIDTISESLVIQCRDARHQKMLGLSGPTRTGQETDDTPSSSKECNLLDE